MIRPLALTVLFCACVLAPVLAQEAKLAGTWVGDAPGPGFYKQEITLKKENNKWSVTGTITKGDQVVATFRSKTVKSADDKTLTFTEEFDKHPPQWKNVGQASVKVTKFDYLMYSRKVGKTSPSARLQNKEAVEAKKAAEAATPVQKPKPPSTEPIAVKDPNKLPHGAGGLTGLLFTADGKTLVTATGDQVVRGWDFEARRQKFGFWAEGDGLSCLAINADASLIAAGGGKKVKVWDASGKPVAEVGGHVISVGSVALSPDGKTLVTTDHFQTVSGHPDGVTKIWELPSGKEVRTLPVPGSGSLSMSPDGTKFALVHGKYVKVPGQPSDPYIHFVAVFSAEGKPLFDAASNHHLVRHTVFSPDGKLLLTACTQGKINLWNVAARKAVRSLKNRAFAYINTVAFSHDGKQFAVGGSGGQVTLYDTASGRELSTFKANPSEIRRVALSPDGRWVLASGSETEVTVTALPEK
jgi:WD40 repeat protein